MHIEILIHPHDRHSWADFYPRLEIALHIFLLLAFSFISLLPGHALAFAGLTYGSQRPLNFTLPVGHIAPLLSIDGSEKTPSQVTFKPGMRVSVYASAYSSTEAQTDASPFITASGTTVHPGTVAANFLPIGTTILLNGKKYTVEDRLNRRYDNEYMIDVWMASLDEALQFGVRLVTFEILYLPQ